MPVKAGIQSTEFRKNWVPAFAGTNGETCYAFALNSVFSISMAMPWPPPMQADEIP